MKKFEILEHKADLKIRAFGKRKDELFLNTMLGMSESMIPEIKQPIEKREKEVKIKSLDFPSLLVDFLNEVLYLTQVNKEIYHDAKFTKFTDNELEVELQGNKVKGFGEDIKAATYHNLDIHQTENGTWEATVLFDV